MFRGSAFVAVASPLFSPASAIERARTSWPSRLNLTSFYVRMVKTPAIEIESANNTTRARTSDWPDSEVGQRSR